MFVSIFQTLSYLLSVVSLALDFVTSPNDFYLKTAVEMTNKKVGADTKIKGLEILEDEKITNIKETSINYTEHIKYFMFSFQVCESIQPREPLSFMLYSSDNLKVSYLNDVSLSTTIPSVVNINHNTG